MAQYDVPQNEPRVSESRRNDARLGEVRLNDPRLTETRNVDVATGGVASPAPLGLVLIGFITAVIGCFYTGFIIPFDSGAMRPGVGIASVILGIILVLAGMWEFRKGYLLTSTTFTAYGGFLALLGLMFMPNLHFLGAVGGDVHLFMGMIFLCWTIILAVLFFGALRTNASLMAVLGVLFLAYLFLTIGSLAGDSTVLLKIGGWLAIATAVISWLAAFASILATSTRNAGTRIPFGNRLAVVE